MSNPGVFTLVEFQLDGKRFCIEDNIGEAIHIHYGNFRLDLTVREFLAMADDMVASIKQLIDVPDFDVENVDPLFLYEISRYLPDLERVTIDKLHLDDLKVDTLLMGCLPIVRGLKHSRIVSALQDNVYENNHHEQTKLLNQDNASRLESVKRYIDEYDYPHNNEYIILFNNQNVIRDGQHRAGCLYIKNPNVFVQVQRLHFKENMYDVSMYPWGRSLFVWSPRRIFYLLKKLKNIYMYKKIYGWKRALYSIGVIRWIWDKYKGVS